MYRSWEDFYKNNPEEKPDPEDCSYEDPIYLCHNCSHFDGENSCDKYPGLPLKFFHRKIYCKFMSRVDWNKVLELLQKDIYRLFFYKTIF